jgi:hypothetical protein
MTVHRELRHFFRCLRSELSQRSNDDTRKIVSPRFDRSAIIFNTHPVSSLQAAPMNIKQKFTPVK